MDSPMLLQGGKLGETLVALVAKGTKNLCQANSLQKRHESLYLRFLEPILG